MTDQQQNYDDEIAYSAGLFDDVKAGSVEVFCRCPKPTPRDTEGQCAACFNKVLEPAKPTFTPTPDQAASIASMRKWFISSKTKFYTQKGYAGTGKTFSISEFIKLLADEGLIKLDEVIFTAPTNKAVKVLRGYLNSAGLSACVSKTIFSLLGLSLQANGEVKELFAREDVIDFGKLKLVVVDEGSMVNKNLMKEITRRSVENKIPFLFMGDPAQLPPVGEITSPIWEIPDQSTLTKVMRYDNAILDLATRLRNVVDHPAPAIKIETAEPVFALRREAFEAKIFDNLGLIKSGDAKVIAWRNTTVNQYNQKIRLHIFGEAAKLQPWLPGDKIVATEPLKNLDDEVFMRTDEEAVVERCVVGHHPKYREYEIYNLLVKMENGVKSTCRVLTPTGQFDLNNKLEQLSTDAKAGKKYLWREFWQLKEAFHQIRHSYAITTHRSQGSSYTKTFVDREDILLNRNRQEAFRSLYVACTRAREELNIV